MPPPATVRRLEPAEVRAHADGLALLLLDAVADGASVGFMADLTREQARAWWLALAEAGDGRAAMAALDAEGVAGALVLAPAAGAFQPHRADIFKLAVHRRARRRGLAEQLMRAAEAEALRMERWLLTLFTRRGCDAEQLYRKLGWSLAGVIPQDSLTPAGALCDAAIYVKRLA